MSLKIERYMNTNRKNQGYGKTYGRVKHNKKVLDIRNLAEHVQSHGSIYTHDVIVGVLAKAEQCTPELLLMGYKLKLEGLGTFKIHAQSKGEENSGDWNVAKDIKKLKVRFLPDQAAYSQMTSAAVTRSSQVGDMFEVLPYIVEGTEVVNGKRRRKISWDAGALDGNNSSSGGNSSSGSGSGGSGNSNDDPDIERP